MVVDFLSSIGNKEIFARNLKHYIAKSGKDRRELAEIWGFPYSTITEWINGKKYPRIDRIEVMADYFGILKSDLIEDKTEEQKEQKKKADTITDATLRMKKDSDFLSLVETLNKLDSAKIASVKQLLSAFLQ